MFKLRQHSDPAKPHVNTECVVGVNYRGVSFFNDHKEPYVSHTFLECRSATARATCVHVELSDGGHLWFQASITAAQEFVSVFTSYREVAVPHEKGGSVTLRTVQVSDGADVAHSANDPVEPQKQALVPVVENRISDTPTVSRQTSKPHAGQGGLFDDSDDD